MKSVITLGLLSLAAGCAVIEPPADNSLSAGSTPEARAISFLQAEVPAWSRENGCFSCHNNGDAARALLAAKRKGYRVPSSALSDTIAWTAQPERWDHNQGDPGFSDQRLADIQFAASLASAMDTGFVRSDQPLRKAARRLVADQFPDGAWHIGPVDTLGSPATYGAHLATHLALQTLRRSNAPDTQNAIEKAGHWLRHAPVDNVPDAATLLLAFKGDASAEVVKIRSACFDLICRAQTGDGGWGPYLDTASEPFDTALVILGLKELPPDDQTLEMIRRGRNYLIATQQPDGSWPETTRPAMRVSYAQRISTAGWATLALLATQ